ncbi:MAG: diguanylate cyclase domain-containing protein [bacterium]
MKIANKINFSFLTIILILVVVSETVFYTITKKGLETELFAHLQTTAKSRQAHIETYLTMLEISVGQLSKSVVLEDYLKRSATDPKRNESFKTAIKRLVRTKEANPAIQEFLLMNIHGLVVTSSNQESIGQNRSIDPLFLGGRNGIYLKDAYFSETLNAPAIAVSDSVVDSNTGKLLGVLAARVNLTELYAIVTARTGLGQSGEMYLVNKSGFMISPSRFIDNTFLTKKVDTENYRMAFLHQNTNRDDEPVVIAPDYRGVMTIGTRVIIPRTNWVLLTEINVEEAFLPLVRLRNFFLIIFFATIIITWLLGTMVARALTKPIHRLHQGTEIIGAGNFDYSVGTPAKDEIGQLSRAFATMTNNLKQTMVSVDSLNLEITERKRIEMLLRENEAKYRTIFEGTSDAVMLATEKGFFDCNLRTLEMFGFRSKDAFIRLHPADVSPPTQPDGQASLPAAITNMQIALQRGSYRFEWIHRRVNGDDFPAEVLLTAFDFGSEKVLQATVRDITERKNIENQLLNSAKEWSDTFDAMSDGVSIQNSDYLIVNANDSLCRMLNKTRQEIIGKKCYQLIHCKDAPIKDCPAGPCILLNKIQYVEIFEPTLDKWVAVTTSPVRDKQGDFQKIIHIIRDITERKTIEQKLSEQATHDSLTGLPNRILLYDRLSLAMTQALRKGSILAVLMLDLDEFKKVNDTLGHEVGDILLTMVANRLTNTLRKGDTVARLGGDEFVLLLWEIDRINDAIKVANKIIERFQQPFEANQYKLNVTTSIGIAIYPTDGKDIKELLKAADTQMYLAKKSGKNTYRLNADNRS